MIPAIECAGDPRRQGGDQGSACARSVQARVRRAGLPTGKRPWAHLRPLTSGTVLGRGAGREIIRHYTHLAERMAGLARESNTPLASLMKLFLQESAAGVREAELGETALAVAGQVTGRPSGGLLRSLRAPGATGSEWIVRRSRPDVGFASVEVTLPWLVSSVAGVNETGVALAYAPHLDAFGNPRAPRPAPSPILLAQECLQRFSDLEGCIEWCLKRPAFGAAGLLISDASGEFAVVTFSGAARRIERGIGGPMAAGATAEMRALACKASDETGTLRLPPSRLDDAEASGAPSGPLAIWIDVEARCLRLGDPSQPESAEVFGVDVARD